MEFSFNRDKKRPYAMNDSHEPPSKRLRDPERNEYRFLIPSKAAGIIIGKGGANIKRLREEFSARVSVPDSNGPERILMIEADFEVCVQVLRNIFAAYSSENTRDVSSIGLTASGDIDLRFLVHHSQAGCIIGKGGAKIKELREAAEIRVLKVYSVPCPGSSDRVVQIIGSGDNILNTLTSIVELLDDAQAQPRGNMIRYDARSFDEMAAESYGGWVSPGPRQNWASNNPRPYTQHQPPQRQQMPPAYTIQPMMRPRGSDMQPAETQQVSIPDNLTGSIMGRGGSRIKQIRMDSGADIRIDKAAPGEDRIITITGTPDQIQNAQYLLQMCVKKYSGQY